MPETPAPGNGLDIGERVLERIRESGVVAVVRTATPRAAVEVSRALLSAGVGVIEVAFTVPGADEAIAALAAGAGDALVGAGTVLTTDQARAAVRAGARFLFSPALTPAVAEVARTAGITYIPGVFTPSEIATALAAGIRVLKLFPARMAGIAGLRALAEPFPDAAFIPTGGVEATDVAQWLRAGAVAVGVGSYLTRGGDPGARAREVLAAVAEARRS